MCEPLINVESAAKILGVHPVTVRELAVEHKIPAMKIGRCWKFRASKLDEWMNRELDSSMPPVSSVEAI